MDNLHSRESETRTYNGAVMSVCPFALSNLHKYRWHLVWESYSKICLENSAIARARVCAERSDY
jgi:hypothetical protein